jgi:hypothetical protein
MGTGTAIAAPAGALPHPLANPAGLGAAARWKTNLSERAHSLFSSRSADLQALVYGSKAVHDPSAEQQQQQKQQKQRGLAAAAAAAGPSGKSKLSLFGDDSDSDAAEDGGMGSEDEEELFRSRRASHAGASTRGGSASGLDAVDLLDSSRAYIALHVSAPAARLPGTPPSRMLLAAWFLCCLEARRLLFHTPCCPSALHCILIFSWLTIPSSLLVSHQVLEAWADSAAVQALRDRFVTGDWEKGRKRSEARPDASGSGSEGGSGSDDDGEVYGEFEDLETGQKFTGGWRRGACCAVLLAGMGAVTVMCDGCDGYWQRFTGGPTVSSSPHYVFCDWWAYCVL